MKSFVRHLSNEDGSAIVIAVLVLLLVTILGISATNTTTIELQIAGNDKIDKTAFYAAEAAGYYVATNPDLYGNANSTVDAGLCYPGDGEDNDDDLEIDEVDEQFLKHALNANQSFNGNIIYKGTTPAPRRAGFEVGEFWAHNYEMTSTGYGPSNATTRIKIGCYRVGFTPTP